MMLLLEILRYKSQNTGSFQNDIHAGNAMKNSESRGLWTKSKDTVQSGPKLSQALPE